MSELEEPQNPYELARWIIDFEFHDPKNRNMNSMKLAEIYASKIEAYISKHYIKKEDVLEAIGEDEDVITVVQQYANNLRTEIKEKLNLGE